jgi:hypothetical protein
MFDWLIIILGGRTKREAAMQDAIVENWRARCLAAETTVELVKEILTREQEARTRMEEDLKDRLYPRHITPPEMQPVGQSRSSWPKMRRELEKQHRVNDNAEVSREKIESEIRG